MCILLCAGGVSVLNKTTITVGSATYAMKAKRVLQRMKIRTKLVKVDAARSKNGCTHGLEFASEDFFSVVMGLNNAGIEYFIY